MKNTEEELVQLNARVPEETKRIARVAAALTDCNIEVLVADALKFYLNIGDVSAIKQQRKKVLKALGGRNPTGSSWGPEMMVSNELTCTA